MQNEKSAVVFFKQLIRIVVSLTLLVIIFMRIDFSGVGEILSYVQFQYVFFSFLVYLLSVFVFALKWKVLLPNQYFLPLLKLTIVGLFYSMIIPGQIAGDGIKAYKLGKEKQNMVHSGISVILDKFLGFVVICVLAIIGLLFNKKGLPKVFLLVFIVCLTGLMILFFILKDKRIIIFFEKKLTEIKKKPKIIEALLRQIALFNQNKNTKFDFKAIIKNIAVGMLYQLIAVSSSMILAYGFGFYVSILDWFWINGFLSILFLLPITIGGLGLREGSLIQLLGLFSIPADIVLAFSLMSFFFQLMIVITGGMLELFSNIRKEA
jgi:uncharacterized protein (TIRG00374 family)